MVVAHGMDNSPLANDVSSVPCVEHLEHSDSIDAIVMEIPIVETSESP